MTIENDCKEIEQEKIVMKKVLAEICLKEKVDDKYPCRRLCGG